jgi:transcriptional regulator EpsA
LTPHDFIFLQRLKEAERERSEAQCNESNPPQEAQERLPLSAEDGIRFMRIVKETLRIRSHDQLYQMLQSMELQQLIPHKVFISAWGPADGSPLTVDIASAIPGIRTATVSQCRYLNEWLDGLNEKWIANGRQPLLLDSTSGSRLDCTGCDCALHRFMQDSWFLLLHGVANARDKNICLYLAFNASAPSTEFPVERFLSVADHVITQLDVAFRRIAPFKPSNASEDKRLLLSSREQEVLLAASEGKSNAAISKLLRISTFTVKNHMQRIMRKLGASNRTEAVAKYRFLDDAQDSRRASEAA